MCFSFLLYMDSLVHNPFYIVIMSMLPCCIVKTTSDTGSPFPTPVLALTVML